MCTPSRSSLMTGKYESNLGMQHFVIPSDAPYGLGLEERTIADYMKVGGYRTSLSKYSNKCLELKKMLHSQIVFNIFQLGSGIWAFLKKNTRRYFEVLIRTLAIWVHTLIISITA